MEIGVQDLVHCIRGKKVILDYDLAKLYDVETKRLNEQVKRNSDRFPEDFMFELNRYEYNEIKSISSHGGRRRALPCAFTEQGVAMLSSVLNSKKAIEVNIHIMRVFVEVRQESFKNTHLIERINSLEKKYDQQFKIVFDTLRDALLPGLEKERKQISLKK